MVSVASRQLPCSCPRSASVLPSPPLSFRPRFTRIALLHPHPQPTSAACAFVTASPVSPLPFPHPLIAPMFHLQASARQDATLALMKELPGLLRKVQTDPSQVGGVRVWMGVCKVCLSGCSGELEQACVWAQR